MKLDFTYDQLATLLRNKRKTTTICPLCSHQRKKKKDRCLGLKIIVGERGDSGVVYNCCHCGVHGAVFSTTKGTVKAAMPVVASRDDSVERKRIARNLWEKSVPIDGTPAAVYLKTRKCYTASPNIRYLPPRGKYQPAMIARFASRNGETNGIHLTFLEPDGSSKVKEGKQKIMIGPSAGWPIIIKAESDDPTDHGYAEDWRTCLCIAEGIEDAISMSIAMAGSAAWAAGSAGRISGIIRKTRLFDSIYLAVDDDDAGRKAIWQAQLIRPDIVPVNFTELMKAGRRMDANSVLMEYGLLQLQACFDWAVGGQHAA